LGEKVIITWSVFMEEDFNGLEHEVEDSAELAKEEETTFTPLFGISYVPEDCRAIPCSPTDVEAVNRALDELYFGRR